MLPRDLHPGAWWLWALAMAVAASQTTNPFILVLIFAAVCHVVVSRRGDGPWASAFKLYLILGAIIIVVRVAFRAFLSAQQGPTIVLALPDIALPDWLAGVRLMGDISAEAILAGLYDGMRLAAMIVCLGAANTLANPRKLLKSLPAALNEIGTAVVIALSIFPQLAESTVRINRARRLRGDTSAGFRRLRSVVVPVLEDALDRSMSLAASMDARGHGRLHIMSTAKRRTIWSLWAGGLVMIGWGVFAMLNPQTWQSVGLVLVIVGAATVIGAMWWSGRRVVRSRYRPATWEFSELLTVVSGIGVAASFVYMAQGSPGIFHPSPWELATPELNWLIIAAVALGCAPSFLTPEPPRTSDSAVYEEGERR